jgi:hypothetical protein
MPQRKITRGFERPSSLFAVVDRDPPPPCVLPTSKIDTIDFSSRGKEKSEEKSQGEENREEKVDYQTLRAQFEDTIRNHHFQRRYSKVSVLLLFWEREDSCDMQTLSEVSMLRPGSALADFWKVQHLSLLFEETLNFRVHERSLNFDPNNKTRLQESIQKPLLDFAYEEDVTGSLLIIYYAGHGSPGVDGGLIDTGYVAKDSGRILLRLTFVYSGNPRTSRNKLDQLVWAQCMDVIPNIDLADSLIIFDCCFAGTSCGTVARHPWPTKAFEFVGGTQSKRPTIPARRESFASALLRSLTELCDDKGGCTTARLCNQTGGVPDPPHNEKTPIADALVRSSHSFILWRSSKRCPGTFKMMLTMAGGLLAETATALVIPNYSAMKQNPSTSERLDGPQVDENGMGGAHLSWSSSNMLLISFWDPARRDDAVSRMVRIRLSLAVC